MEPVATCEHCGARISGRWERLSKGLCRTLIKFWQTDRGMEPLHLMKECGFTTNEINNFQKLRYFGLVKKTELAGYWQLTDLGKAFVFDSIGVPRSVCVFRNHVVERSDEIAPITALMQTDPYWLQRGDFPPVPIEPRRGI